MFKSVVALSAAVFGANAAPGKCPSGFEVKDGGCIPGVNFATDSFFLEWSRKSWDKAALSADVEHARVQEIIEKIPEYPTDEFHGRGIVMVAGGDYLRDAMVTIASIREFGCKLRIQVWHNGEYEIPSTTLGFFDKYGVETYNIADYDETTDIASNVGSRPFQLKPLALLHTDFEEVLMLDADSTPIKDPTFLFETDQYKATGSLFWPDYWTTHSGNPIWDVTGVPASTEWEFESGQMVINKALAWKAVSLVTNLQTDMYYSLLNGDKDTFKFAWKMAGVEYSLNEHWPAAIGMERSTMAKDGSTGFCAHSMGQHDFDGNLLFVHHNQLKLAWGWTKGAFFTQKKVAANAESNYKVGIVGPLAIGASDITCFDMEVATPAGTTTSASVESSALAGWSELYFSLFDEVKMFFPVTFIDRHRRKANGTSTAAPGTQVTQAAPTAAPVAPTAAPTAAPVAPTAAPTAAPVAECVFPFVYKNVEYTACSSADVAQGTTWCATSVNQDNSYATWKNCDASDPTAAPTAAPVAPTAAPTAAPVPTVAPTVAPTPAPTPAPIVYVNIITVMIQNDCNIANVVAAFESATGLVNGVGFLSAGVCVPAGGAQRVDDGTSTVDILPTALDTTAEQVAAYKSATMALLPGATVSSSLVDLNAVANDFSIPSCGASAGKAGKQQGGGDSMGKGGKKGGKSPKGVKKGGGKKGGKRNRRESQSNVNAKTGASTTNSFVSGNTLCVASSLKGAKPKKSEASIAISSVAGFVLVGVAVGALVMSRRSKTGSEDLAPLLETAENVVVESKTISM